MITERYRQSMHITAGDIFSDFNDPKKQTLVKRVVVALQDQEKRLKAELDSNNLASLQILIKKQQAIKNLQEKLNNKDQQISQLKIRLNVSTAKMEQLQKEANKKTQITSQAEEKVKALSSSVKNLELAIQSRETLQQTLRKQKQTLINRAEQLQQQKARQEKLISNLRNSYHQKVEETDYVLKIKQKQMADEFTQNLSQIVIKAQKQKQKEQIKNRLDQNSNKVPTRSQRVQCELIALTGRQSPSPRKRIKGHQIGMQTDKIQQKILQQIIVQNEKIKQPEKQLEEVRLMFSKTPQVSQISQAHQPKHTPKVTSYISVFTQQREAQTQKIIIQEKIVSRNIQQVQVDIKTVNPQIQKYKQRMTAMRQYYENRYQDLKLLWKRKQEELQKVQHYKLDILQLNLKFQKREQQFAKQREILTKMNQQLQVTQSQFMLRKFSSKLCQQKANKTNNSKTCSFFYKKNKVEPKEQKERKELRLSGILTRNPEQKSINIQDSPMLSPKKWDEEQADIITVIKKTNKLTFFNNKRRSTTESASPGSTIVSNLSIARRAYRKYSNSKKI